MLIFVLSSSVGSLFVSGCDDDPEPEPELVEPPLWCPGTEDLAALVDPMIGTDGSGNTIPGALVPHGMVRLGPDTNARGGSVDAYQYDNDRIEGFTHTQLQGPGGSANGYSHVLLMPITGPLAVDEESYSSAFSHETEEASPGYYAVTLEDSEVRVELTATGHAGLHRYTFPAKADGARVVFDLGHSLGVSEGGHVEISGERVVRGYGVYNVHPALGLLLSPPSGPSIGQSKVYFHAELDLPFTSRGTWIGESGSVEINEGSSEQDGENIGAWIGFGTHSEERTVEVRIGISLVSEDQAALNLEREIGDLGFDEVRSQARDRWNCYLNRVVVEGGSHEERVSFYTALYHTLFQPAIYSEAGGDFFSAADGVGEVFRWTDRQFYTDDWCAWDTFRTSRPLATIVEPETVSDVVASYLHLFEQGGWLPKCTWHATGYSRVMIGNHGVAIVADAFVKGLRGYDEDLAWEALYRSATEDENPFPEVMCGYFNLGMPSDYLDLGYISHECDSHQSASMTLEYAYNDWCIAQVAGEMGRDEDHEHFMTRSLNFENHWDEDVGFMRGRSRDGSWVEPFDPTNDEDANDFCEATSWIYSWYVPHDVPALIELMGGEGAFIERLDRFFADDHFESSNEPSFHVPFLYNYAGAPERTQEIMREVLAADFSTAPDGLPGNDDAGATSAWYVLGAIGLFPVAPGDGVYQLSSPLFDRVTLHLNPDVYEGETFVIETTGIGPENIYVTAVSLNDEPIERWWITHDELIAGGTLTLEMGVE